MVERFMTMRKSAPKRQTRSQLPMGRPPKVLQAYRHNARTNQVLLLDQYLHLITQECADNPKYLLTEQGQKAMDAVLRLEIKDRQIEAQKEMNTAPLNPLLVILKEAESKGVKGAIDITPACKMIDGVDGMREHTLDKQVGQQLANIMNP